MSKKVLVVEDDFANQQVASLLLAKFGYQVDVAENGQICLEKTAQTAYDLILMDCQMPIVNGYEAARKIRETQDENQMTPIIALTANILDGVNEKCKQAGMDDLLNKPIKVDILKQLVKEWVDKKSSYNPK